MAEICAVPCVHKFILQPKNKNIRVKDIWKPSSRIMDLRNWREEPHWHAVQHRLRSYIGLALRLFKIILSIPQIPHSRKPLLCIFRFCCRILPYPLQLSARVIGNAMLAHDRSYGATSMEWTRNSPIFQRVSNAVNANLNLISLSKKCQEHRITYLFRFSVASFAALSFLWIWSFSLRRENLRQSKADCWRPRRLASRRLLQPEDITQSLRAMAVGRKYSTWHYNNYDKIMLQIRQPLRESPRQSPDLEFSGESILKILAAAASSLIFSRTSGSIPSLAT